MRQDVLFAEIDLNGLVLVVEVGLPLHMSNFFNARRGLSPEAVDRLLDVLRVGILDLADPEELRQALRRPNVRRRSIARP